MKPQRVLLVVNETKPAAVRVGLEIAAWCQSRGIECSEAPARGMTADAAAHARLKGAVVCALGGDGTVLRAAALVAGSEVPVLGVNVGSLGFLSQTSLESLFPALEAIADGNFEIEKRMRLAYRAAELGGTALNDLVLAAVEPRLLEIRLSWDGVPVSSLPGDGVIFATPTGTTAYNLSLGGPIVVPTAECFVVTPHAAHVLGVRSLVFSCDDELRVSASAAMRLLADGDEVGRVPAGQDIVVRRAETPTLLVRPAGAPGFFGTLTEKLNWPGANPRRSC
jgi:NAD+ kinase